MKTSLAVEAPSPPPKTPTKSFEETLWDTANKLRGSVESSEYKHVVLSLIFLKFVSDKFEERRAELVAEGKDDYLDIVEFYTMQNVFYLPETSRWSYIQQQAKQGDIALKIDSALTAVEKSNASLKGALPDNYFSIMDFRNVTALFADKDFDGDPVRVKEAGEDDDISGSDDEADDRPINDDLTGENIIFSDTDTPDITFNEDPDEYGKRRKVTVNGVEVTIIKERVQYMGGDGKIITESLRDYTRKNVLTSYASLDTFLNSWKEATKKRAIIEELESNGVLFAALKDEVGSAFDPFDLICHVAYEQPPLTRRERAKQVRKRDYFTKYGTLARKVLDSLLDKYADDGLHDLEDPAIITLDPIKQLGNAPEIVRAFGGKPAYKQAIQELTGILYEVA